MSDNLETLRAARRGDNSSPSREPPLRAKLSRKLAMLLPLLLLAGFFLFAWWLFGDRFTSARAVEIETVVTLRTLDEGGGGEGVGPPSGADAFEAKTLFQASGWIEPDPLPIRATALYSGIVDEVHVLEGERVSEGQLLATLVDDDARLDHETALAALAEYQAGARSLDAAVRVARAAIETLRLEIDAAASRLVELEDDAERFAKAGAEVYPAREIDQAKLRVATQRKHIKALRARIGETEAQLASRQAQAERARHKVAKAKTEVARKKLALERTRIHSPVDGIIQRLFVSPGTKRIVGMDDPDSATVAKLFQPDSLQARIDVPLEEAAQLAVGQAVRLRSSFFPNREFRGRVTRIEGQADLQRNTLQAKVALLDPDPKLRPEMLCRAEFLTAGPSGEGVAEGTGSSGRVAVYVPEAAVLDAQGSPSVWLLDVSGEGVVRREIKLSGERRDGHLRVNHGLKPGDRVVIRPPQDLKAGDRVKAVAETN